MTMNDLPAAIGALLVIAGIVQVFVQMFRNPPGDREDRQVISQSAKFEPKGFTIQSAYPGMTMICAGVVLLIAGHFFAR